MVKNLYFDATASKSYNRQRILECLAKFVQFCANMQIKDVNEFQITEKKAEMGFFSIFLTHNILEFCVLYNIIFIEFYVLYNIIYTKDSRILECSRIFLHYNIAKHSRIFCRWCYAYS